MWRRVGHVRARHWRWVLVGMVVAGAGCSTQGLVLEQPKQVQDLKPTPYSKTKLPFTVSWTARPLAGGERYFVIVDQQPMPPGDSVKSLTDDICRRTPGCPDKFYLQQHFMFLTRGHRVEVQFLPLSGPFPVKDLYDLHKATIVIVDERGDRVGEEFWSTDFYAKRI
jgi:hypothetical protein